MISAGYAGEGIRGDARVRVEAAGAFSLELESAVEAMYGDHIREQVATVWKSLGSPPLKLRIEDSGALPFVLQARLESALARHLGVELPALAPAVRATRPISAVRTRLYVPGNTPKLFPNVGLYGPDAIILDLEDSVPTEAKIDSRALVRYALHSLDWGPALRFVRINAGPEGFEDVRAVASQGVDAIILPKAENGAEVAALDSLLAELDVPTRIIPILETARGVLNALEIAEASPRVSALAIGLEDYLADIHAERAADGAASAWAEGQIVNAARAAGVSPLASVYSRIDDEEGLTAYVLRARAMGFDGIGCIHPRQIETVHKLLGPSEPELERARAIVRQFENAVEMGIGSIGVDGQMVDAPVYERAKRIVEGAGR